MKRTNTIILWITLIAALLLGIFTMTSPTPKDKEDWFSAKRAFTHLEVIAKHQHSVFDLNEIEEVRNYLEETLNTFDHVNWTRVRHSPIEVNNRKTRTRESINIDNIYAEIPGTSGMYMLIVAHFDSSPYKEKYGVGTEGSYGAADDGYGIATMLEIMKLLNDFAEKNTLVNGIKFAFTDAEEVALGGAKALVTEYAHWLKDVNIVLNLEARGNKGPLYMFQTNNNNSKLIDFYSHARLPFSFSIAADVYKHLPNDTDFTPFLKAGYTGLNFATLKSLKYYHTPLDNLGNADMATLQFYGEQIYPLVIEYISKEKYSTKESFISNKNAVFFTLFPGFMVYYSQTVSWVLTILAFLFIVTLAFYTIRKKALSWKKALLTFTIWIGFILFSTIVGLLLTKFIGLLTGNPFSFTYMPHVPFDFWLMIIFAMLVLVLGVFVAKLCHRLKYGVNDMLGGAVLLLLLLNTAFAFLLHGGTFLFIWPALFMLTILALNLFWPSGKRWWKHILPTLAVLVTSTMYIMLIYSLFLALTFGALAVILLFTGILGCVLVQFKNCFTFASD